MFFLVSRLHVAAFISLLCLFVLVCLRSLLWMIHRASEQKRINVAEHLNGSSPRQLDLDLYLGVYAGDARRAHIAFLCTVEALNAPAIQ